MESAFTKPSCSLAERSWSRATKRRDSDALWRASRNARLRKRGGGRRKIPLTRVADLCISYFLSLPDNAVARVRHLRASRAIIRWQIRAAAVCSKFGAHRRPAFSLTPLIRCLLFFFSPSSDLAFFRCSREPFPNGFLAMAFVFFRALDVLMMVHLKVTRYNRFNSSYRVLINRGRF